MTEKTDKSPSSTAPLKGKALREARLKLALKANMARRKAQAKAREETIISPDEAPPSTPDAEQT